jgi:hypothetical protein
LTSAYFNDIIIILFLQLKLEAIEACVNPANCLGFSMYSIINCHRLQHVSCCQLPLASACGFKKLI